MPVCNPDKSIGPASVQTKSVKGSGEIYNLLLLFIAFFFTPVGFEFSQWPQKDSFKLWRHLWVHRQVYQAIMNNEKIQSGSKMRSLSTRYLTYISVKKTGFCASLQDFSLFHRRQPGAPCKAAVRSVRGNVGGIISDDARSGDERGHQWLSRSRVADSVTSAIDIMWGHLYSVV